jgi:hypothetical protein
VRGMRRRLCGSNASTTPMVWKFVCFPMFLYTCERLVRVYRG